MKLSSSKIITLLLLIFFTLVTYAQKFQGKAYYFSKSKMELGNWGARMSEAQKKQIQSRLKNRLEKKYILSFNMQESTFLRRFCICFFCASLILAPQFPNSIFDLEK